MSKRFVVPARQAGYRFVGSFKGLQIRALVLKGRIYIRFEIFKDCVSSALSDTLRLNSKSRVQIGVVCSSARVSNNKSNHLKWSKWSNRFCERKT